MNDLAVRAWIAVGLEVVFLSSAFGWRSLVQWRRTGSTGFVRPRRGASAVERAGSLSFVVALVLLLAAPVVALVGASTIDGFDSAAVGVAGAVLGAVGIVLTVTAQLSMGASWRIGVDPGERTELVTAGIFARMRNPIFSAMMLAAVGLVLLVPSAISVAALVILVAGIVMQVLWVEEPYLGNVHGERYARYVQHTGRFLPRLKRRSAT